MNQKLINLEIAKSKNEHRELGKVSWYRDYEFALQESRRTDKPILLLFQEIPGCATCVNFGQEVLSHPLMVEVIENKFIPLAIFNNKPGKDSEILKRFNEPAWNNPVTYFLDKNGKSIIPKLSNNYHPLAMYNKIKELLIKTESVIPEYFNLLEGDLKIDYGYADKVYYETPCFWSGETTMARHESVLSTEAGFIGHKEVVEVYFDTNIASIDSLNENALEEGFFLLKGGNYRVDKIPQYYLEKTKYKYLPLSNTQKAKINRAIPYKEQPERYLSPIQLDWLSDEFLVSKSDSKMYTKSISEAWEVLKEKEEGYNAADK